MTVVLILYKHVLSLIKSGLKTHRDVTFLEYFLYDLNFLYDLKASAI